MRSPDGPSPRDARSTAVDPRGRSGTYRRVRSTLDGLLPSASVDSNWWYWIAAVPALFLVGLVAGVAAAGLAIFGVVLDVAGLGGLATFGGSLLFGVGGLLFALVGVAVAVLFPVATYVDARAVQRSGLRWDPDPVLYGGAAAAAVIATNFVLSVPLSLYYLYRRHKAVGTP